MYVVVAIIRYPLDKRLSSRQTVILLKHILGTERISITASKVKEPEK